MNSFFVKILIVLGFMIIFAYMWDLLKKLLRKLSVSSQKKSKIERVDNQKDKKEHPLLFGILELIFDIADVFLF